MPSNRFAVLVSLAVLYIVWGSTYLAQRIAVSTFTPLQMVGLRFTVAGALLYAVLRARGARPPSLGEWRRAAITATPLMILGMGAAGYALRRVPSGLGALVFGAVPLFTSLFSRLMGRRLAATEAAGLALGFAGVACVSLRGGLAQDPFGAGLLVVAAALYALGCALTARLALAPGALGTATQMLFAGVVLLTASLALGEPWSPPTRASLIALVHLIVLGSMAAYTALGYLLRNVRPSLATSYAFVNPIVALGLGAALAGERVTHGDLAGLLLVLAAVGLVARARRPPAPERAASPLTPPDVQLSA